MVVDTHSNRQWAKAMSEDTMQGAAFQFDPELFKPMIDQAVEAAFARRNKRGLWWPTGSAIRSPWRPPCSALNLTSSGMNDSAAESRRRASFAGESATCMRI